MMQGRKDKKVSDPLAEYMTYAEVAARLGVSMPTIQRMIKAGAIVKRPILDRVLFLRAEVETFARERETVR